MSSRSRRLSRPLLLSVSLVALLAAVPSAALSASQLAAAAAGAQSAAARKTVKATGPELLKKTQRALSVTAAAVRAMPRAARSRSAPFVKAIGETDKALKAIGHAIGGKDKAKLAKAVSAASRAAGRLNATYKKAALKDSGAAEGMRAFNAAWPETLKRLGGTKAKATPQKARENARRIAALRGRAEAQRQRAGITPGELEDLIYLIAALDRAFTLNRSPEYQWLAVCELDGVYGWYGGVYDYYAVYEPGYVAYYQEDYDYWRGVSDGIESSYEGYYDDYGFEAYDQPQVIDNSVNINITSIDSSIVLAADRQIDTVDSEAEAIAGDTDGSDRLDAIDAAEEAAPLPAVEDPADVADPAVDAAADEPVSEEEAEAAAAEDPGVVPDEGAAGAPDDGEQEAAPDEVPDEVAPEEEAAPDEGAAPEDPASDEEAAPEEAAPEEETAPEEQPAPDEAAPEEQEPEESAPEEAAPEEAAPEEAAPEEQPADDGGDQDGG